MSYLIRQINKAKWLQIDILKDDDVSGDAITNCLHTSLNKLSFWHIDNNDELESAILALAAKLQHLETIDIVILEQNRIEKYNIGIIATPGETPVFSLNESHRDLEKLTFSKLAALKDYIVEQFRKDQIIRYRKGPLKKIMNDAISNGLLKKEDLNEAVRNKI